MERQLPNLQPATGNDLAGQRVACASSATGGDVLADHETDALRHRRDTLRDRLKVSAVGTTANHPGREAIAAELAVVNAQIRSRAAAPSSQGGRE